jgi:hypothetical protein
LRACQSAKGGAKKGVQEYQFPHDGFILSNLMRK